MICLAGPSSSSCRRSAGLCGVFNQRLVERARAEVRQLASTGDAVVIACLGRQGQRLLQAAGEQLAYEAPLPSFTLPAYLDIEKVAIDILDLMEERACGRLIVMYNTQTHRFQYEITSRQLFPVEASPTTSSTGKTEVKPAADAEELFTHLVTERVLIELYEAVVESSISEELARVAAMRLATDNARHLLESLTLDANRARQIAETNALLEIISGFHAASDPGDAVT